MVKKNKKEMEKDEQLVIKQLQQNSNLSISDIANNCGFSRQKVWRIRNNLEKNETIWGYPAVVNEEKLQRKSFLVLIKRTTKPLDKDFSKKIINNNGGQIVKKLGVTIDSSFYVNGLFDWVVMFTAKDLKNAKKYCETLLREYSGYILEIHLLENLFWLQKHGVTNPGKEKLSNLA